jgi:hypothetical protein
LLVKAANREKGPKKTALRLLTALTMKRPYQNVAFSQQIKRTAPLILTE